MDNIPLDERAPNLIVTSCYEDSREDLIFLKALGILWETKKNVFLFQTGSATINEMHPMT